MNTSLSRPYMSRQIIRRVCELMAAGKSSHIEIPAALRAAAPTREQIIEAGNAALARLLHKTRS